MAEPRKPGDLDSLRIDAPLSRPGLRRSLPLVEILIVGCILLAAWLLAGDKLAALLPSAVQGSQPDPQPHQAATETDNTGSSLPPAAPGEIVAGGYIEIIPPGATVVSSDVDARITAILAVPGQTVSEGELLATLDSSQLELELGKLRAEREVASRELELARAGSRSEEIEAARALVSSAKAELELAREEAQRAIELFERGVVSKAEMRTFETRRDTAEQKHNAALSELGRLEAGTRVEEISIAEARIGQLDSSISELNWRIAHCSVRSPVDGVVLEQLAEIGDWAGVAKDDPSSAAILSIYDPQRVQAWADINQRDSGLLAVGQPVMLTTDAQPNRQVRSVLSAIMPLASIQKNTVQVKLSIDEVPEDFRPGLGVRVAIDTRDAAAGGNATENDNGEAGDG
ncbi:HlyD family efflux transporter periplasmic adaptor subunit [bacterium]|nr:HlyD family efflux transporter periplasmic adaptor subunit [bacterium]